MLGPTKPFFFSLKGLYVSFFLKIQASGHSCSTKPYGSLSSSIGPKSLNPPMVRRIS